MIDLDIVNKMKIPLQKIKVCRMTYMGENLRSVGYIDQTIQCVNNGVIQGTIHLSAKVVRNLFESLNVDCIASSKTYERLTGKKPPDPPDVRDTEDDDLKDNAQKVCDKDNYSSGSSSVCSDGRHDPITKEWLYKASLIASAAQQDDADTLLRTENDQSQQRMPNLPNTYDQTKGIDVRGRLEIQGREDLPEEIREGAEEEEE